MCEVQCLTAYSTDGLGAEMYLLNESTTLLPALSIIEVHDNPPFDKEMVRVPSERNSAVTRTKTAEVRHIV